MKTNRSQKCLTLHCYQLFSNCHGSVYIILLAMLPPVTPHTKQKLNHTRQPVSIPKFLRKKKKIYKEY